MHTPINLWMAWSSGKDSAFALHELLKNPAYKVTGIFPTITETYDRVAMHATRRELLLKQAEQLGLPLEIVPIPAGCTNERYEAEMAKLIVKARAVNVTAFGFGDLFLADVRDYRIKILAGTGIEPVFPLWDRPTYALAREMISSGIEAVLTCCMPPKLTREFAGRKFDDSLLADFPRDVDPCGENGEFHTFVYNSPDFKQPIAVRVGETVEREGFVFADVLSN